MTPIQEFTHVAKLRQAELNAMSPEERLDDANLTLTTDERRHVIAKLHTMPKSSISRYLKARKGNSPATAIKAHCDECMGYNRADVEKCTAPACPLYIYSR